jgi:hypothetical protein
VKQRRFTTRGAKCCIHHPATLGSTRLQHPIDGSTFMNCSSASSNGPLSHRAGSPARTRRSP